MRWIKQGTLTDYLPADPSRDVGPREVHAAAYSYVTPSRFKAEPSLIIRSPEVSTQLGLSDEAGLLGLLSGRVIPPDIDPYAMCYGGHQFGQWAGQLGDGRAIVLGEILDIDQRPKTLQLKGCGMTPYSRGADGRAVLRSSVREFLCSEAMHFLGVPTSRALSLVGTNDKVLRDRLYDGNPALEPGAVVCRVAPSFLRFGSLELPASRQDNTLVRSTIDYLLAAHFKEIEKCGVEGAYALLERVSRLSARLVVEWMRVGFVHGVLNTDNMSLHGLTIDYGPYGWLEEYDLNWTPNITDAQGRRYAFGRQPEIVLWNLTRLAEALYGICKDVDRLRASIAVYKESFERQYPDMLRRKLGLAGENTSADIQLTNMLSSVLELGRFDFTHFFLCLSGCSFDGSQIDSEPRLVERFESASYASTFTTNATEALSEFLKQYSNRLKRTCVEDQARRNIMQTANPCFVLRNYLVQIAIEKAEQGDYSEIYKLLDSARNPYEQGSNETHYQMMPDWARQKIGCSMLSCSS